MALSNGLLKVLGSFRSVAVAADLTALGEMAAAATAATVVGGPVVVCGAVGIAAIAGYGMYCDWKDGKKLDKIHDIEQWLTQQARKDGAQKRSLEAVLEHALDDPKALAALPEGVTSDPLAALLAIIKAKGDEQESLVRKHAMLAKSINQVLLCEFERFQSALDLQHGDLIRIRNDLRRTHDKLDILEWLWQAEKQPPRYIPSLEDEEESRFHYAARRVTMRGRESELDELLAFLDGEERFSWACWTGPAGTGKSRLALELCLQCQDTWDVGFFNWRVDRSVSWDSWSPQADTLIVFDYVYEHAEAISKAIAELARARPALAHKVRFLLLERPAPGMDGYHTEGKAQDGSAPSFSLAGNSWWETLIDAAHDGNSKQIAQTCATQDQGKPTARPLAGLSSETVADILSEIAGKDDNKLSAEQTKKRVAEIGRVDPMRRPLFVAFAAEAMASGDLTPQWNAEDLVRHILKKEQARWGRSLSNGGIEGPDQKRWTNLLLLSTLCGGLAVPDEGSVLDDESLSEWLPTVSQYDDGTAFGHLVPGAHGRLIPKLEPDMLGECFVLESLRDWSRRDIALCSAAWRHDKSGLGDFLTRSVASFPGHPALDRLLTPSGEPDAIPGVDPWQLIGPLALRSNLTVGSDRYAETCLRCNTTLVGLLRPIVNSDPSSGRVPSILAKGLFNAFHHSEPGSEDAAGYLGELRDLHETYPEDAAVRELLAEGLFNAFHDSEPGSEDAAGYLGELRDLHEAHPEDAAVREQLAKGLFNAFHDSEPGSEDAAGYLGELRDLHEAHPEDAANRELLAKGLFNAFHDSEPGSEDAVRYLGELHHLHEAHPKDAVVREALVKGLLSAFNRSEPGSEDAARYLGELRDLHEAHPEDAAVSVPLAEGLLNAFHDSEPGSEDAAGYLGELRDLHEAHPEDAAVRELLAEGLFNAFHDSEPGSEDAAGYLGELRDLHEAHPEDAAVREQLAKGLFNAFHDSEPGSEDAAGYLGELRDLHEAHPEDAANREALVKGLLSAFNRSEPGSEDAARYLGELRDLHEAYPKDAVVRERLAKGLFNAFNRSEPGSEHAADYLGELRDLHKAHPGDAAVSEPLAMGLSNAILKSGANETTIRNWLDQLEELSGKPDSSPDVREAWGSGLVNAFVSPRVGESTKLECLEALQKLAEAYPKELVLSESYSCGLGAGIDNACIARELALAVERAVALVPLRAAVHDQESRLPLFKQTIARAVSLAREQGDAEAEKRLVAVQEALFGTE